MYGLTESQLAMYFEKANRHLGNTRNMLVHYLEMRMDNVVYRLGFAPTRAAARQLVNHGHFLLNDKKATIPSQMVKVDDRISFKKEKTTAIPYVQELLSKKDTTIPQWLDRKAAVGKVTGVPEGDAVGEAVNLQAVIEFYSR
jgi:small subunit ribosomal protein S4